MEQMDSKKPVGVEMLGHWKKSMLKWKVNSQGSGSKRNGRMNDCEIIGK